jgi:putative copper export protein
LAGVALPGSALLAVSGVWVSWWYVGSLEGLVGTPYGRTLIVKLLLIGGVLACGFVNWRRYRDVPLIPFGGNHIRDARLPAVTMVLVELVFAALVVVATSLLTELEHPTG